MLLPNWALRKAGPEDWEDAIKAIETMKAKVEFFDRKSLKAWMKSKGWKRSWIFPTMSFSKHLIRSKANYELALRENIIEIWIPKSAYRIPDAFIEEIDQFYQNESWDAAVESLRSIRRAIEAGVVIQLDDEEFKFVSSFYSWAHKRYHILEEASDQWILDDK